MTIQTRPTALRSGCRGSVPERAADKVAHDLAGPSVEALNARVTPEPGDLVLVHVAVTAMDLQAAVDDLPLRLGRPQLGARRLLRGQLAGVDRLDAPVDIDLHDVQLDAHVRDRVPVDLEGADRSA